MLLENQNNQNLNVEWAILVKGKTAIIQYLQYNVV